MYKLLLISAVLLGCSTFVSKNVEAQDVISSNEILVQCTVCHGTQLMGNKSNGAPRLSGLPGWYIRSQIEEFQNGERGVHKEDYNGAEMRPIAQLLTSKLIKEAITFVEKIDSPLPKTTLQGNPEVGKALYAQCSACHGKTAGGKKILKAPPLEGLDDWYMLTQLKHFKSGVRGGNSSNSKVKSMVSAAQTLADENAMIDVLSYISQLKNKQED